MYIHEYYINIWCWRDVQSNSLIHEEQTEININS